MKNYTFNWEIKDLITQFFGAIDAGIVKRYNEDKESQGDISVRYVYAPKGRTLHWLVNQQQNIALPVASAYISGIKRQPNRVFNKIDGPEYPKNAISKPLQPIPIDITMNLSLLAKYQNDMDQMVSNFVPYFDPYIIVSWKHPYIDEEIRSPIKWNGNLSYNYPTELNATDKYRVGVDTSFTIEGWLFKNADGNVGPIYTVYSNFYGVSGFDTLEGLTEDSYLDYRNTLSGDYFITTSGDL